MNALIPFEVLYEDNHLLVVNKPCGVATQGMPSGETSLITLAKDYLKRKYDKPGNVYVGVVSRLDRPVTGVVVLARTSKAASRLSEQFREREVEKFYWALVAAMPNPPEGRLEHWLGDNARGRKSVVHDDEDEAGDLRHAALNYRTLRRITGGALLEIKLETGRKHQIRAQLADQGWPIIGDFKYGQRTPFPQRGIGLHARRLVIKHPVRDELIDITAPVPAAWRQFGVSSTL